MVQLLASVATAQQVERFEVHGNAIYYDMDINYYEDDWSGEGYRTDQKIITALLNNNPNTEKIYITGLGGDFLDALSIANRISALGIDTEATGDCLSACALIFLGGANRKVQAGAVLGFHRASIEPEDLREQYEVMREERGWADEFAFAEWLYELGQIDARNFLGFALMQGVDPEAVQKMLIAGRDDMWRPAHEEILAYRIITND